MAILLPQTRVSASAVMLSTKVRLMWPPCERMTPPVDEGCVHTRRLGAHAIELMVGDQQHLVHRHAHLAGRHFVGRTVWLERLASAAEITTSNGMP